jgi:hypothetical protein
MTRKATLFLQAAAICTAGVALSLTLYSAWFRGCCIDRLRDPIGFLIFPAVLFATLIGGGVHSATPVDFTIGLMLELLSFWGIYLLIRNVRLKRSRQLTNSRAGRDR